MRRQTTEEAFQELSKAVDQLRAAIGEMYERHPIFWAVMFLALWALSVWDLACRVGYDVGCEWED